ncbi:integrator complex subunit 8 [Lingula anatina]|uniref:Integrator complex subunit 8 n=1 Tax=Lingula anatina TaxID=7574 RepID=A0A1S3H7F7_LINAN|nr:integrator complex subunit 8 [Lingula anatina]|eukprot:XP_013381421.1 integrator complex subunit 8 [Lingula anatina]
MADTERSETPDITAVAHASTGKSWFEFLLDEALLEKHLLGDNPDPSGTQLILQFLQHAEAVPNVGKDQTSNGTEGKGDEKQGEPKSGENKKTKALKLLALKIAAFLKWDLDVLDKSIPLSMMSALLTELVKIAFPQDLDPETLKDGDLSLLPDETVFALMLYHRWCVKTAIKDSFPSRPTKTLNVPVPGVVDPTLGLNGANKSMLESVKSQLTGSALILEKCSNLTKSLMMPSIDSIAGLHENTETITHQWDKGQLIPNEELICQICYDLGCYHFFHENYQQAHAMFTKSSSLLQKVVNPHFLRLDRSRLSGYCSACNALLNMEVKSDAPSLQERVEQCRKNNFKGIVELLREDNQKSELSVHYRVSVEEEIRKLNNLPLLFQVCTCNIIRQVLEGKAILSPYLDMLEGESESNLQLILEMSSEVIKKCSFPKKTNLKCFLSHLCQSLPASTNFTSGLLKSDLRQQFDQREVEELQSYQHEDQDFMKLGPAPHTELNDTSSLERQVLITYEPKKLKELLVKLQGKLTRQQLMVLSDKWKVSRDIQRGFDSLVSCLDQVYGYICLVKAKQCTQMKMFQSAHDLLLASDASVKDLSYKLSKLIRWEILQVDIQLFQQADGFLESSTVQDIMKRTKTCITSLRLDSDMSPSSDIVGHCVAFLLNIKDWDYLGNLDNTNSGYIEFGRLLSLLCKELPNMKESRKAAREVWEAVLQIFTTTEQQKRSSSGAPSSMKRESNLGLISRAHFVQFIQRIKDPVVLSALVSCVTKLYNLLKNDLTSEISSDYVTMWPTALGSSSQLNLPAVSDAVTTLMQHAVFVNPTQPSWLKTQADLHFAHAQYSGAMHCYMEAALVASDYFSRPVPKTILDDQVYKRLIKSCNYLQCYTQAAVLCQVLEEVDYVTAFRSFQEKHCQDAMDAYYDCIWDVTILEFLINLHAKKGELEKKQRALHAIGQLELNSSNSEDILVLAKQKRMQKFLRTLAKHYL